MPDERALRRFEADLEAFANRLDVGVGVVTQRVALQVFTGVVQKTPVDTGRAKSNWGINVGAPSPPPSHAMTEEESKSRRKAGNKANAASEEAKALAYASAELGSVDGSDAVHITNNLPYIQALNDGHSDQAPKGFVEDTVAEVAQVIQEIITE